MIDLYYWTTPNGHKVTMFLEESGLDVRHYLSANTPEELASILADDPSIP